MGNHNWVDTVEGREFNRMQEIFRKRRKAAASEAGMKAIMSRFQYPDATRKVAASMIRRASAPRFFKRAWYWRAWYAAMNFFARAGAVLAGRG